MAARSAEEPPAGVRNVVCIYLNKEVVEKESRSCAVGKNARHNLIEQVMSFRDLKWSLRVGGARKKESKQRRGSVTTSWFAGPEDLAVHPAYASSEDVHIQLEYQRLSGAVDEGEPSSGGLKSCSRFYGSTGNLLDMTDGREKTNLTKRHLGKSLQLLPTSSAACGSNSELGPFRVENGLECKRGQICNLQAMTLHEHALLENPECEIRWYFRYFLGKYHCNYLCYDWEKSPIFLSVVSSDAMDSIYRCIIWKKTGNKRLSVKHDFKGKLPSPKAILEKCSVKVDRNIKEIFSPAIQKDLLTLEEQEGAVSFKFGVLYARAGQKTDDEMYCNQYSSERFQMFLELLGDEVQLRGWEQFRGGLDCKNDSTGLSSVYTLFEGHEIMFHVSTLLPYTAENKQQLERKRHIGNDIVVIIFVDYDTDPEDAYRSVLMDFDPSCMRSHFNHIFALVSYNHLTECYRLIVYSAESVPEFGPPLPFKAEFPNSAAFRDFLLAKLINGEKAAYCTPTFSEKRERTLGLLLKGLEEDYNHEMRRASSTPVLNHSPLSYKKYNEREQAFTEYGQRLKVEKIITGNHPTSHRTTVAPKREPWETECVVDNFPFKISHGDVCDDGTLVVATPHDGSYIIYRDGGYSQVMDQSISVGQLVVAHRHNLFMFRTNFVKEVNYVYAVPLKTLFTSNDQLAKQNLSQYQIPHSKNVSLFCTSPLSDQFLRLAVAVKTKVVMVAYKHPASMMLNGSPITPVASKLPKDTFIKHRELNLLDVPTHMALLDERPSGKLCVTYQKLLVVDAIDEIKATTQRIPNVDIVKTKVTSLTSIHSNGHSELLIGYNLTCHLVTLHDNTAYNSAEIVWNTEPRDLAYLHPYMLAFTEHSIEIRMAANGSLMQTISVPDLHLISTKGDLYFTSSSSMIHTGGTSSGNNSARGSALLTSSVSQPVPKLPKNIDKRDFLNSSKFSSDYGVDATYVYRIDLESMTGRRDVETPALGSTTSLRHSLSDDSISRTDVVSIASSDDCTSEGSTLDFIHPKDDYIPVIHTSFEEDDPAPLGGHTHNHHHGSYHGNHHHSQYYQSKGTSSRNISRESSSSFPHHRNHSHSAHRTVEVRSNSFGPASSSNGGNSSRSNGSSGGLSTPYGSQYSAPGSVSASGSGLDSTRLSPPPPLRGSDGSFSQVKIKRSKKVLTSRKSLDSNSRYLHPSPEHMLLGGSGSRKAKPVEGNHIRCGHNMVEVLVAMDNACSSPDSGVHDDFSLPSNYSEPNSNSAS